MSSVDALTLKILSALGKNPKALLRALSRDVGLSSVSLKKRIERMLSDKLLYGVSARINPFTLGLKMEIVFVEAAPDKLALVERVCDLHPYAHYRVRCFGPINGLFIIFYVPIDTTYLLIDLLEELTKDNIIQKWILEMPTSFPIGCEADYSFYEPGVGWKFDWSKWAKSIESIEPLEPKIEKNVLNLLDKIDMQILRELSKNILRRRSDIAKDAGVELYHLDKRWKRLEDLGVIEGYRILVGMHFLQLTSHVLFKCKSSMRNSMRIASAIKTLPFQSTFFFTSEGFILYIMMTPIDYSLLASALREYCERMEVYWCDYHSSLRYYFYDEAFSNGSWRSDIDFMVNSILEKIREERK
ncbi:MAG: winged helix-turn-helix transcriptional regulator [Candidatus Bathyarchaeia archaeon]